MDELYCEEHSRVQLQLLVVVVAVEGMYARKGVYALVVYVRTVL